MENTRANELLIIHISEIIQNKNRSIKVSANGELINLFWEIGKILNKYIKADDTYSLSTIKNLSKNLEESFGSYFNFRNIIKMGLFADYFSDFSKVRNIFYFVNWEHILCLLTLDNPKVRQFFLKLTILDGLNVNELKSKIFAFQNTKNLDKIKISKSDPLSGINKLKLSTGFIQIPQLSIEKKTLIEKNIGDLFKDPFLVSFRSLTKPSKTILKNNI